MVKDGTEVGLRAKARQEAAGGDRKSEVYKSLYQISDKPLNSHNSESLKWEWYR